VDSNHRFLSRNESVASSFSVSLVSGQVSTPKSAPGNPEPSSLIGCTATAAPRPPVRASARRRASRTLWRAEPGVRQSDPGRPQVAFCRRARPLNAWARRSYHVRCASPGCRAHRESRRLKAKMGALRCSATDAARAGRADTAPPQLLLGNWSVPAPIAWMKRSFFA